MTIKCPRCEENLMNIDRQGIAIDICPKCKGVWLDREELDEIINRSQGILDEAGQESSYDNKDMISDLFGEEDEESE